MWEIKACHKNDSLYPKCMRDLSAAPDILYYVGDISLCDAPMIAIIGKREAKEQYLRLARYYGALLAQKGHAVLNGLAVGCDAEALEGAIGENGKTIAVMPSGLDVIYPKVNQKLAEQIVENGGCLISEYPQGTKPQKYTYVQRDRIQAMLAYKVLVVECEKDSGTMHTVDYALKLNKPLGCLIEPEERETPSGNKFLIENNKANCIRNTEDFFAFLNEPEYSQLTLF